MTKKYGVILIDPPWKFLTFSEKGQGKSASNHYDVQTIEDICNFPVSDYADDDCALFMWQTWPHIFESQKVFDAWGFKYSGLAWEWIKYSEKTEKFSFGNGYGTRKNLEPLLLARKGTPKVLNHSVRDFMISPRREHSRKPDATNERIERMYKGPYLEMCARQQKPNWDAWGFEIEKFDFEIEK